MTRRMHGRRKARVHLTRERGVSLLEYIIIAALLIAVILAIRTPFKTAVEKIYNNAVAKVDTAGDRLGALPLPED